MSADETTTAYIAKLRADFEEQSKAIRIRHLALGYAFGRTDEHHALTGEYPESALGGPFADFYEQHTDGNWTDLNDQYVTFQSREDSSSE